MFKRDFVEPWFEEDNRVVNPFWRWKPHVAGLIKLSARTGRHNVGLKPTMQPIATINRTGKINGKVFKAWEVAEEHRKGRRIDIDTIQCQMRHIFAGGAKGMKGRRYMVDGHLPLPNTRRPKPRKGLEMETGTGGERKSGSCRGGIIRRHE